MATARDIIRFVRPEYLPGLEVVTASYVGRIFPVHSHPEYVLGVVTQGAEELRIRGASHVVATGSALLIRPQEAHANAALGPGRLTYRVLYVPAQLLEGADQRAVWFPRPVISDPVLAGELLRIHSEIGSPSDRPRQEAALASLRALLGQVGGAEPSPVEQGLRKVHRAHEFLRANYRGNPSLDDLAALAGSSTFHFLRCFRARYGLSPIAYRNQLRVMEARRLLLAGLPITDVAADLGYADQSHLTRQFLRVMGTTPGRYARQ